MLVIWRGFGWTIPVILLASLFLMQWSLNSIYGEGYYGNSEWPKVAAIIVGTILIGGLGYLLNYKKRIVVVNEETGKKEKSKSHSLFFIPMEFWVLIVPVLFFLLQNYNAEKDAKYMAFIESPEINDKYHVDFTKIFEDSDKKFKYGVIKVISISSVGVEAIISEMAYDKKSGVNKDIREGKVNNTGYFSKKGVTFEKEELMRLKNIEAIYSVSRN